MPDKPQPPSNEGTQSRLKKRLTRWAKEFAGRDVHPSSVHNERNMDAGVSTRNADKLLYEQIGEFLFTHALDLTPLNFSLAYDYLTGDNDELQAAIRSRLEGNQQITNSWVIETLADNDPAISIDTLTAMLDQVEKHMVNVVALIEQSKESANSYGAAIEAQSLSLAHDTVHQPVLKQLVILTRAMIERARQVEQKLQENQQHTIYLKGKLERARLSSESDHLTGLPNRRAFEARLIKEVERSKTNKTPLALAICDIDNFKSVNDTHGHDTGDRVLRFVAKLFLNNADDRIYVARFGGEEFVILLSEMTAAQACAVIDDIREDLCTRSLVNRSNGQSLDKLSFSAGVSNLMQYEDAYAALNAADRALYLAKQHGRNRVYIATDAP